MEDKHTCTPENPYNGQEGKWTHPEAVCVGSMDYDYYSIDKYECPICGLKFSVEIAQ